MSGVENAHGQRVHRISVARIPVSNFFCPLRAAAVIAVGAQGAVRLSRERSWCTFPCSLECFIEQLKATLRQMHPVGLPRRTLERDAVGSTEGCLGLSLIECLLKLPKFPWLGSLVCFSKQGVSQSTQLTRNSQLTVVNRYYPTSMLSSLSVVLIAPDRRTSSRLARHFQSLK